MTTTEETDMSGVDWRSFALCAEVGSALFFQDDGGSSWEAKRICSGCEVRAECLDFALAHNERFGVWGGLSDGERRRIRRTKAAAARADFLADLDVA
jgi:WhiB family redox-sensing transcriptional regulator